jgi:hypothetical protein
MATPHADFQAKRCSDAPGNPKTVAAHHGHVTVVKTLVEIAPLGRGGEASRF